jgi:hypothetical protein
MQEIKNAIIRETLLGYDDCGVFTYRIQLDYGGSGQAAGMITLGGEYTHKVVKGLIDIVGVKCWEELKGKYVRVIAESTRVHNIGNILDDGRWFNIETGEYTAIIISPRQTAMIERKL